MFGYAVLEKLDRILQVQRNNGIRIRIRNRESEILHIAVWTSRLANN